MPFSESADTTSGLRGGYYRPLDEPDINRIVDAAFEILANTGMMVRSPTARRALKSAGAEIDSTEQIVYMPRSMVEDAIASNPSSITLHGRNGGHDVVLEKNRVHYGTGGTALYILDREDGRRSATIQDVILNARIVEALENLHVFTINVFPHDVESTDNIDINRFFHALDNTNKHVMGGVYSLKGCKKVVEMAQLIAGSPEELRREPFVSFITLIISPFKVDEHYGEMTCYLAKQGLPVVVPTEPICGTTSPVTLAANVLMHVTETLGGITLVQSVNKGAPGICGSVGSITNLQTMDHVGGAVERGMIHAAVAQIAQHLELPLYSTAGCTDAKSVDVQAAYETAMMNTLVAMSGANYIHDAAGLMEADLTVSYEKLVIDNEILGMCQRVLRGIEVTDESMALELMLSKSPGEDFMAEDHTVANMRSEFFTPTMANRERREQYEHNDAMQRARSFVDEISSTPRESLLDGDVREAVLGRYQEIAR